MRDGAFFSAVRRRTAAVTVRQFGRRAHRLTSLRNRPAHGARTRPPIVAGWFAILKHHVGGELPCVYTPKTTTFFFFFFFFLLASSSFPLLGQELTNEARNAPHAVGVLGACAERRDSCPCRLSQVPRGYTGLCRRPPLFYRLPHP